LINQDLRTEYLHRVNSVRRSIFKRRELNAFKLKVLEAENGGTKLYKYVGIESAQIILAKGTLLLRDPFYFNDPFDCLARVAVWDNQTRFGPNPKEVRFVQNTLQKLPPKFQPQDDRLFHDLRLAYKYLITCFSPEPKSHLMWSHYADHHKGVCLEFDIGDLIDHIHPCHYATEVESLKLAQNDIRLALVKNAAWAYEEEWRFLFETIRPKMRLVGQIISRIYNQVHADPEFGRFEHEEWSEIQSRIMSEMESEYAEQQILRIKPTKVIIGAKFAAHQTNTNTTQKCKEIISAARTNNIPISLMQFKAGTFDFDEVKIEKKMITWLDLDPEIRASLPVTISDDTTVLYSPSE
jgi:Protein of unknown function (DUF2971)